MSRGQWIVVISGAIWLAIWTPPIMMFYQETDRLPVNFIDILNFYMDLS